MGLVGRKGKLSITENATDIREVAWQRYEDVLTADEEATLVRVPVETITDQVALEAIVVSPLAALLKNERVTSIDLLSDVETELWPSVHAGPTENEENDSEEA